MAILEEFIRFLQDGFSKYIPEDKRRIILAGAGGLVLILAIIALISGISGRETRTEKPDTLNIRIAIPPQELFLPEEPDFLRGVILGREQRSSWTEEDASAYWLDPLVKGEEEWRKKIEAAIDEFLERIP
ncbi:MAG: hypothetical protein LBH44_14130 [Treponema sp.]|jgi:hypothetical protein|nr:hypothetical protein [Treponema sp.]